MKLLICEDEAVSREGIAQLVPAALFSRIELAANGAQALEIAEAFKPDVLLTDIRMPRMDGLELASRMRAAFPQLRIVFISAYADKDYFKKAISVQADAYLEKPIDEQEFVACLKRLCEAFRRQKEDMNDRTARDRQAEQFSRQQLLWAILRRNLSKERLSQIDPRLTEEVGSASCFLPVSLQLRLADAQGSQFGTAANSHILEELQRMLPQGMLLTQLSAAQIAMVLYGDMIPSQAEIQQRLQKMLETNLFSGVSGICICVGRTCSSLDQLQQTYKQAHEQAMWRDFLGLKADCRICTPPSPPQQEAVAAVRQLLSQGKTADAEALIRGEEQKLCSLINSDAAAVRSYCEKLLTACLRASHLNELEVLNCLSTFNKLKTLPEMMRFICVRIRDILPEPEITPGSSDKVLKAQEFIRRHIDDPSLSIQMIADEIGITENYLSGLYKKDTGSTLHHLITDLRMQRARYMLERGYRVQDTAIRCGYTSVAYFLNAFHKHTGMSPTEYLQSLEKGDKP